MESTYSYTRFTVSQSYLGPSDYLSGFLTSKQTNKQIENYDFRDPVKKSAGSVLEK